MESYVEVLGPVTYNVEVNGNCVKRHVNQMLGVKGKPKPFDSNGLL